MADKVGVLGKLILIMVGVIAFMFIGSMIYNMGYDAGDKEASFREDYFCDMSRHTCESKLELCYMKTNTIEDDCDARVFNESARCIYLLLNQTYSYNKYINESCTCTDGPFAQVEQEADDNRIFINGRWYTWDKYY